VSLTRWSATPTARSQSSGSERRRTFRQLSVKANFYEKALFVKVDVATALWLRQLLCPSRYASICTLGELTLFGSPVHYGIRLFEPKAL
jgi:hypothetical protein